MTNIYEKALDTLANAIAGAKIFSHILGKKKPKSIPAVGAKKFDPQEYKRKQREQAVLAKRHAEVEQEKAEYARKQREQAVLAKRNAEVEQEKTQYQQSAAKNAKKQRIEGKKAKLGKHLSSSGSPIILNDTKAPGTSLVPTSGKTKTGFAPAYSKEQKARNKKIKQAYKNTEQVLSNTQNKGQKKYLTVTNPHGTSLMVKECFEILCSVIDEVLSEEWHG